LTPPTAPSRRRHPAAHLNYLDARARQLIDLLYYLVEAVATELLERSTLSRVAVHRVIRGAVLDRAKDDPPGRVHVKHVQIKNPDGTVDQVTVAPRRRDARHRASAAGGSVVANDQSTLFSARRKEIDCRCWASIATDRKQRGGRVEELGFLPLPSPFRGIECARSRS
jgi:hypothetical protein